MKKILTIILILISSAAMAGQISFSDGAIYFTDGIIYFAPTATTLPDGVVLWLDAADSSTIQADGSGYVATWEDKSGNGYDATQTDSDHKPKTGLATVNGLNVLSFDGSDNVNMAAATIPTGSTPYTIFTVWNASGNDQCVFIVGSKTTADAVFLYTTSTQKVRHGWWSYDQNTGDNVITYSTSCYTCVFAGGQAYDERATRVNGASEASDNPNFIKTTGSTLAVLGAYSDGATSQSLNGTIAEHIVYHRVLTSDEIAQVETYLAEKWGL